MVSAFQMLGILRKQRGALECFSGISVELPDKVDVKRLCDMKFIGSPLKYQEL